MSPLPGAAWDGEGTRFTLRSRHAEAVELCLFDRDGGAAGRTVALERRTEDLWSARLPGVGPGQRYGYRVRGPWRPQEGQRFNPAKLLVDPYARAVTGEPRHEPSLFAHDPAAGTDSFSSLDSAAACPRGVVVDPRFDWRGDRPPRTPWRDTVIYEAHVRGLTFRHPEVPAAERGRYGGVASEPMIAHYRRLGVTAVELLPVTQIASEPALAGRGLTNYWGYSPLGFFAPHAGYASGGDGEQVVEWKRMVRALHRAGIEVIIDLVLNHTCEGDETGPTLSLRGIDNRGYYRLDPRNRRRYVDFTGCGNTLDSSSPAVRDLVLDVLRYWAAEMRVDGFRFDLATVLGRGSAAEPAFDPAAPLLAAIADDPALAETKLIVEPWDLGPDGYQRGSFPPRFAEWDDRFRDQARRAWLGLASNAGNLVRRLADGDRGGRPIVFVACHDGFTLADATAYARKHNLANGEADQDGSDHEVSANHGTEGPTLDPAIHAARARAVRNLLATLWLAPDVPMLGHGDELGRSQGGNNNAYCQDNATSWIDWRAADRDLIAFVGRLARLRRRHRGDPSTRLLINPTAAPLRVELPAGRWRVLLDTASEGGKDAERSHEGTVDVAPRSLRLVRRNRPR